MIEIDKSLNCKLHSSDNTIKKNTLIYVPGFGTMGKSKTNIVKRLLTQNPNTNIVTFTYNSHLTNTLSNFNSDTKNLETIVKLLKKNGINKKDTGFISLCYGAFITADYLQTENEFKYAIFIEPYLGLSSFNKLTQGIFRYLRHLKVIPIGKRYQNKIGYIDLESTYRQLKREIKPIDIPLLGISTSYHFLFNRQYIKKWLNASSGTYIEIKNNSLFSINSIIQNYIKQF